MPIRPKFASRANSRYGFATQGEARMLKSGLIVLGVLILGSIALSLVGSILNLSIALIRVLLGFGLVIFLIWLIAQTLRSPRTK